MQCHLVVCVQPLELWISFIYLSLDDALYVEWNGMKVLFRNKKFITFFLKGAIMEGSDADIVVWDPNGERHISASTHSQVSERDGLTHLADPRYYVLACMCMIILLYNEEFLFSVKSIVFPPFTGCGFQYI